MNPDNGSFYQDNMYYEVEVVDLLSPETTTFTVGHNGRVSSYPTKKPIRLPGREIAVLLDARIPKEQFEIVDGLRKVTGYTSEARFAVSMRKFGMFPSATAAILQPFGSQAAHISAPDDLARDPNVDSPDDIGAMSEPTPDGDFGSIDDADRRQALEERRAELEASTFEVLVEHAKSLDVDATVGRRKKGALIDAILAAEMASFDTPHPSEG